MNINRSYARHIARIRMQEAGIKKPGKKMSNWRAWVHGPERKQSGR